LTGGD